MGQKPSTLPAVHYSRQESRIDTNPPYTRPNVVRKLVGLDVFCEHVGTTAEVAKAMQTCDQGPLKLRMISSRGMSVWPDGFAQTLLCDHWRCRFMVDDPENGAAFSHADAVALLERVNRLGMEFIKTEGLYYFDGKPEFQMGQGQK